MEPYFELSFKWHSFKILSDFERMLIEGKNVDLMNKNKSKNCSFKFQILELLGDERKD